jgi:hypothetical protein
MSEIRIWRETPRRYRLEASRCDGCGKLFFPPRPVCDACRGRAFSTTTLPETGRVVSHTTVHSPPSRFGGHAPYTVAIIELDLPPGEPCVRLTAQLTDLEGHDVHTGMPVQLELRRIQEDDRSSVIGYGYKAVPTE